MIDNDNQESFLKVSNAFDVYFNNLLKKVGIIVTSFVSKRKIKKYKLNKEHSTKKVRRVLLPPVLQYECSMVDMSQFAANGYKLSIARFVKIMESNFPRIYLINFYNNLQNLEVISGKFNLRNFLSGKSVVGTYSAKENSIKVDDDYSDSIYHELLHMASSAFVDGVLYVGFRQAAEEDNFESFGRGLNEGYTELLTERYFVDLKHVIGPYFYETRIASHIEEIVGRSRMEKLYLTSNLKDLVNDLKKYTSEDKILGFIENLDVFSDYVNSKKTRKKKIDEINELFYKINVFILEVYINKMKKMFFDGEIDINELTLRLVSFRNSLVVTKNISGLKLEVNKLCKQLDLMVSEALCECGYTLGQSEVNFGNRRK